jgi:hypothetical protein
LNSRSSHTRWRNAVSFIKAGSTLHSLGGQLAKEAYRTACNAVSTLESTPAFASANSQLSPNCQSWCRTSHERPRLTHQRAQASAWHGFGVAITASKVEWRCEA